MEDQKQEKYKPIFVLRIIRILLILSFLVYVITGFLMHIDMRSDKEKEREKEYRSSVFANVAYTETVFVLKPPIGLSEGNVINTITMEAKGESISWL